MKYSFPELCTHICYNAGINDIWVLDAHESNYFSWPQTEDYPRMIKSADTENICISCASLAVSENNIGACIFPCSSSLVEALGPLFEFNRERIPLVIFCFINDYDMAPENILIPILRNCNFFMQIIADISDASNMIKHAIQYSNSELKVSLILISDYHLRNKAEVENYDLIKTKIERPVIIPYKSVIDDISSIINEFDKITLVCGNRCENALYEINQLSEKINSPVIYTPELRNLTERNVKNSCGILGRWTDPIAYKAISESDLIIIFDNSHKNFIDINKKTKIIQISPISLTDIDPLNINRTYSANIKESLQLIIPLIAQKSDARFLKAIKKDKEEYLDIIHKENGPIPNILIKLADTISKKIKDKVYLCSEGEYAFFFQNILLKPDFSNNVFHLDELRNKSSSLPSLIGLAMNSEISGVIGMIDSDVLHSHMSCFLNLVLSKKNIKILAFNKHPEQRGNKSNLYLLCKSIGIEYHNIDKEEEMITGVNQWYEYANISAIEIFLDMSEQIMLPTFNVTEFNIPDKIINRLFESLHKFDIGSIIFHQDIIDKKNYSEKTHEIITNRNIFYSAIGAFSVNKKIPVCIVNGLYDLLHMMPGIFEAKRQTIPLIIIVFNGASNRGEQYYKESFTLLRLVNSVSGFHQIVNLNRDLNLFIGDSISQAIQLKNISTLIFQNYANFKDKIECKVDMNPYNINSHVYPAEEIIKEVAVLINNSVNPIIFAGNYARDYKDEIFKFSEYLSSPLGWSLRSKDIFDNAEYGIGILGIMSEDATREAITKSDLIILIGIEFSFSDSVPNGTKIIQIDEDALNLGLIRNIEYGIIGNIKDTLDLIKEKINRKLVSQNSILLINQFRNQYINYIDSIKDKEKELSRLTFEGVIAIINETAPNNSWIISDMTLTWFVSSLIMQGKGNRHLCYTGDNVYSTNSSAYAIGVDFEETDSCKIIITTDIAFRKQVDSLRKMIMDKVNVKIIVIHLLNDVNKQIIFSHLIDKDAATDRKSVV